MIGAWKAFIQGEIDERRFTGSPDDAVNMFQVGEM